MCCIRTLDVIEAGSLFTLVSTQENHISETQPEIDHFQFNMLHITTHTSEDCLLGEAKRLAD